MASKFQKQLVGTVILVGISVAILPSLFDGKKWNDDVSPKAIPLYTQSTALLEHHSNDQAMQEIVDSGFEQNAMPYDENEDTPNKNITQTSTPPLAPPLENQQTRTTSADTPTHHPQTTDKTDKTDNKLPQRYVIQLGAFTNHQMADELVNFLKPKGYNAFLLKTNDVSRVFIGPSNSQELLTNEIPKLKTMTGIDGKIVALK